MSDCTPFSRQYSFDCALAACTQRPSGLAQRRRTLNVLQATIFYVRTSLSAELLPPLRQTARCVLGICRECCFYSLLFQGILYSFLDFSPFAMLFRAVQLSRYDTHSTTFSLRDTFSDSLTFSIRYSLDNVPFTQLSRTAQRFRYNAHALLSTFSSFSNA